MKRLRTFFKIIADVLLIALVLALVCVTVLAVVAKLSGNGQVIVGNIAFGRVVTGSMEPDIPTGSFILAKATPISELAEGDVIMFFSEDPSVPDGVPVTHRIESSAIDGQGNRVFITKGDANEITDPYPVRESSVIGRVVLCSPLLGELVEFSQKPFVFPVLIGILLVDLIVNVFVVSSQAKALKDERNNGEQNKDEQDSDEQKKEEQPEE